MKTAIKVGVWIRIRFGLGLGLDYGLGFSSDIRLRQDPQLRVSHLATSIYLFEFGRHLGPAPLRVHAQMGMKFKPRFSLEQTSFFSSPTISLPRNFAGSAHVISSTSRNLCRCFRNSSMNEATLQSQRKEFRPSFLKQK